MSHQSNSYFLNVLVFSINVACNSENLFLITGAKVGKKNDLCQKCKFFSQKTYVNVYEKTVAQSF
jgi:hypothetical protein